MVFLLILVLGCGGTSGAAPPKSGGETPEATKTVEQSAEAVAAEQERVELPMPEKPTTPPPNEDGYELWLRYQPVQDVELLAEYRAALAYLVAPTEEGAASETLRVAQEELERGLSGMLSRPLRFAPAWQGAGGVILGTPQTSEEVQAMEEELRPLGSEGYLIRAPRAGSPLIVASQGDAGLLYGTFALLRHLQERKPLSELSQSSRPRIALRMLNHWDNLDRSVERGYAGRSLWDWSSLPGELSPRYTDYARANASLGVNGTVLTNVNANAQVLTPEYLAKVRALAEAFRPYALRVYLTARFSAPIEIGGLSTADPLDAQVKAWWQAKAREIYTAIPDFGGFLVKANSEGQPGPQDYGRSHADGANMLADAVAPFGGIVLWRAFVYSADVKVDRIRQAYDEFQPLDGSFRDNVLVQPKNGPLDFQPREPFHPLLGGMPKTPLALELQITKEYLGQDTHLAYLGPMYQEVLRADTRAGGETATVASIVTGEHDGHSLSAIAGVANIGDDRNWTGSHFNQANWYVFGRMAWDPMASARAVAEEWVRLTLSTEPYVVQEVADIMMGSHQTLVNYMTPLGLVHIMAAGHHYGPGPWVDHLGRPDWNSVYYHRADAEGIGFDRTESGSNAVAQYHPEVRRLFGSRESVPDDFLLFFHRVGWNEQMSTGRTLWHELVHRYSEGVSEAQAMLERFSQLEGFIDPQRFSEMQKFLAIQADEARWWRDANLQYFQQFSQQAIPEGYTPPAHPLSFYRDLDCPKDRDRPRCPEIYSSPELR